MRGFTISARCPAISARRRRRISSSLLPLNIGPQTTSSQPPRSGKRRITRGTLMAAPDGLPRDAAGVLELPLGESAQTHDPERTPVLHHGEVAEVAVEHDSRRLLDQGDDTSAQQAREPPILEDAAGGLAAGAVEDGVLLEVDLPDRRAADMAGLAEPSVHPVGLLVGGAALAEREPPLELGVDRRGEPLDLLV